MILPMPRRLRSVSYTHLVNSGVEKVSEGMVGTVEKVLVEDINRQDGNILTAVSYTHLKHDN